MPPFVWSNCGSELPADSICESRDRGVASSDKPREHQPGGSSNVLLIDIVIGGLFGLLAAWIAGDLALAILFSPVCITWAVPTTASAAALISLFRRNLRRPRFSMRAVLGFVTVFAASMAVAQATLQGRVDWFFRWGRSYQWLRETPLFAVFAVGVLATLPAGVWFITRQADKKEQLTAAKALFLVGVFSFLTAPLAVFLISVPFGMGNSLGAAVLAPTVVVSFALMVGSSIAMLIDAVLNQRNTAYKRRAAVAFLISAHLYLSIVIFQAG